MRMMIRNLKTIAALTVAAVLGVAAVAVSLNSEKTDAATIDQTQSQLAVPNEPTFEPGSKVRIDRSGRARSGKASFYADRYSGKTMADGTPMRLYSNNAASMTLPLGTTAKVTNLETGKTAIVIIRDRGPYVKGRIVDLSPATAKLIGISRKKGLAEVEVLPISIPVSHADARMAALNPR